MNFSYCSDDDRKAIGVQAVNRGNFTNIGGATSVRLADTLNPQVSDPTSEFRFRPSNPSWGRLRSFGNSCSFSTGHCRERLSREPLSWSYESIPITSRSVANPERMATPAIRRSAYRPSGRGLISCGGRMRGNTSAMAAAIARTLRSSPETPATSMPPIGNPSGIWPIGRDTVGAPMTGV